MQRPLHVAMVLVGLTLAWPSIAHAQHHGHVRGGAVFVGGYFYDPFFGPYPWWPAAAYPYAYYPVYDSRADVRVMVTPREAEVYVDGYYAGVVNNFDGTFQRLPLSPGAHEVALHLDGYRTVHQQLYLTPGSTYKLRYTMERLPAGEASEPPPVPPPPVPAPPPGSARQPRPPRGRFGPPPQQEPMPPSDGGPPMAGSSTSDYGSLAIRVQPADAEVTIDGERWNTSEGAERLSIAMAAGPHRIEIRKAGYRPFSMEVQVRPNDTTPVNVVLSAERPQ